MRLLRLSQGLPRLGGSVTLLAIGILVGFVFGLIIGDLYA